MTVMKKIISLMLIVGILASTLTAFALVPVKVLVDSKELVFAEGDVEAQIINNSTMIPMREIFESLGANLNWVAETKTIIATRSDGNIVTLEIGSKNMVITNVISGENVTVELPVAPMLITAPNKAKFGARTVVPLRAISEGLNMNVDWDGDTYTATATKK